MENKELLEKIFKDGCHEEVLEQDIEVTWSSVDDYDEEFGFYMWEEQKETLKAGSRVRTYISVWDTSDFVDDEKEYYTVGVMVNDELEDIDGELFWNEDACCMAMAEFWKKVWAGETEITI